MSWERKVGRRGFLGVTGAAVVGAVVGAPAMAAVGQRAYASENAVEPDPDRYVDVQLVNITDLHGYLQPTETAGYNIVNDFTGRALVVGGVGYLAAHLKRIRAGRPNSIFFAAGDNFSGWPFEADAMANEPTVEVLNRMGLQFSTLGNHELDQRFPEFLIDHMEKGTPLAMPGRDDSFVDSTGKRFRGADFAFYSSNVVFSDSGYTVVPPYNIVYVNAGRGRKLPIGFIHLTVMGTTTGSTSYQPDMSQLDELASINKYAAVLKKKGVNAIVLVMHDGGLAGHDINGLTNPTGPCFQLAAQASPDIAAVVTGHWHEPFNGMLPDPNGVPRPVVEAGCYGQLINEITLKLDPRTGEVVRQLTTSINHPTTHDIPPDPELQTIANYWVDEGVKRYNAPIARQTADFTRMASSLGESTMSDLAADVVLWLGNQDGSSADLAIFAARPLTGSTALHGDGLFYAAGDTPGDTDGVVLFGDAWNAFGYGNPVLTVSVTGAQIHTALESQWVTKGNTVAFAPLAVSANVQYRVDASQPVGQRIDPTEIQLSGRPLDLSASYRLAGLCYTLIGADGTTAFHGFTDAVRNDRDHEGFIRYLREHPTISPAPLTRAQAKN